jgi:hypothetical protein
MPGMAKKNIKPGWRKVKFGDVVRLSVRHGMGTGNFSEKLVT